MPISESTKLENSRNFYRDFNESGYREEIFHRITDLQEQTDRIAIALSSLENKGLDVKGLSDRDRVVFHNFVSSATNGPFFSASSAAFPAARAPARIVECLQITIDAINQASSGLC
jgi:hypothetical protein